MTNTTTIPAGYIVHDADGVIMGYGPSRDAAWADMKNTMAQANIEIWSDGDDEDATEWFGSHIRESDLKTLPASAALLAQVEDRGGNVAWGHGGRIGKFAGLACTVEEADGAIA